MIYMSRKTGSVIGILLIALLAMAVPASADGGMYSTGGAPTSNVGMTLGGDIGGGMGWITFHTNVDGASIYVDGAYEGTTTNGVYTMAVYSTGSPLRSAYAAKSGYSESNRVSLTMPSPGENIDYYLTLNPIQTSGSISVRSSPSNAVVYIDDVYVGTTPVTQSGYSQGYHNVRITKSGYQEWASSVYVYSGSTATASATLIPIESYGSIYVSSTPSGASVYLDGSYMGISPKTISSVTKGGHTLRLEKAGYNTWESSVTVNPGQTSYVYPTLQPLSAPTGTLYVTSSPGGAYIYLDGVYQGIAPASGSMVISNVATGTHTVTAKLSGYQDASMSVTVNGGSTASVTIPLKSTGPAMGYLSASSMPTGANVYVNNDYMGVTPLTVSLAEGTYNVRFSLAGYYDSTVTATVTAGATSSVTSSLTPNPGNVQKSGSPAFAAIIGIFAVAALLVAIRRND